MYVAITYCVNIKKHLPKINDVHSFLGCDGDFAKIAQM